MGNTSNLFLQNLSHVSLAQQQLMKFENIHTNNVSMELFFLWNEFIFFSIIRILFRLNFHLYNFLIQLYPAATGKGLTVFSSFAETGLTWRSPSDGTSGCSRNRVSTSLEN